MVVISKVVGLWEIFIFFFKVVQFSNIQTCNYIYKFHSSPLLLIKLIINLGSLFLTDKMFEILPWSSLFHFFQTWLFVKVIWSSFQQQVILVHSHFTLEISGSKNQLNMFRFLAYWAWFYFSILQFKKKMLGQSISFQISIPLFTFTQFQHRKSKIFCPKSC